VALPDDLEEEFDLYKTNCGEFNTDKYPIYSVVITHIRKDKNGNPIPANPDAPVIRKDGLDFFQDHFTFLKTESGFKLVSMSLSDATLK